MEWLAPNVLSPGKARQGKASIWEMGRLRGIRHTENTCVASVKQSFAVNWQEIRNASTKMRLWGAGFLPGLIDVMRFNGLLMARVWSKVVGGVYRGHFPATSKLGWHLHQRVYYHSWGLFLPLSVRWLFSAHFFHTVLFLLKDCSGWGADTSCC